MGCRLQRARERHIRGWRQRGELCLRWGCGTMWGGKVADRHARLESYQMLLDAAALMNCGPACLLDIALLFELQFGLQLALRPPALRLRASWNSH